MEINRVIEILKLYVAQVELPEPCWDGQAMYYRLVGQICAIGGAHGWDAIEDPETRAMLHPKAIRGAVNPLLHVWEALRKHGVRYIPDTPKYVEYQYAPKKVQAVLKNAHSPFVYSQLSHKFVLPDVIKGWAALLGPVSDIPQSLDQYTLNRKQAGQIRNLLIDNFRMIGPKSASNFLIGLGLTLDLIALDVRLLNLLINWKILHPQDRNRVPNINKYCLMEEQLYQQLCIPLGCTLMHLDQAMFNGYDELKGIR